MGNLRDLQSICDKMCPYFPFLVVITAPRRPSQSHQTLLGYICPHYLIYMITRPGERRHVLSAYFLCDVKYLLYLTNPQSD